ncbi:hypothetical protein V9T40_011839 [Parthenolecanium corni]|uniref:L-aminoadipate-semialdehyde dehydrogenase-phosphopantetheinyl transferase n=1 Tax=Parthenolecanium corni TaxID=536013 RepID=A0AAN9XZX0_9HEMI
MNHNRRSIRWIFDCSKWYPTRQEWATASTSIQYDEKERIGKFFFKRDAKNSMAGRLLMRKFLTLYSDIRWKDIEILRAEHGKPYFKTVGDGLPLNFNISHQGNYAVLAGEVGDVAVGIDIMTVDYKSGDRLTEFLRLMKKQFSIEEWNILKKPEYSEQEVCRMFYRLWCLKESYLKATGMGLTESLKDVSFVIKEEKLLESKFTVSTEVFVCGELLKDWSFHEIIIDNDTFVAVALSPPCEPLTDEFQFLTFDELVSEAEEIIPFDQDYCDNFFKKQNLPNSGGGCLLASCIETCEISWTTSVTDSHQYLIFEFKDWKVINEIITQGHSSNDFVSEYMVYYGSNGQDYMTYRTSSGLPKIFPANTDSHSLKQNKFDVPIIARWIRINPVRWTNTISLKVELYGCDYDANKLHFSGKSLIKWNLQDFPIHSASNRISLRIKTNKADGVILYSRGTLGDYLALQIYDNKMELNINLGSCDQTTLSVGSLLDDDVWHDISISHENRVISLSVDRVSVHKNASGDYFKLNLDKFFYVGGILASQNGLDVFENFTGCIDNLVVNSVNIGKELKRIYDSKDEYQIKLHSKQNVQFYCQDLSPTPITFLGEASFVRLQGYENQNSLHVAFHFKTYEEDGLLMYHNFRDGFVKVFLSGYGKLFIELETPNNPLVKFQNFEKSFNDGRWYELSLQIFSNKLLLRVNEEQAVTNRLITVVTGSSIYFGGGVPSTKGFLGCIKKMVINGIVINPLDWKLNEEYFLDNQIVFNACQMTDKCNPNPCDHGGICRQSTTDFVCDCSNTDYVGSVCHKSKLPRSCESYKLLNDFSQTENIDIDIDGSGPLEPFPVTCQFHADGKIVTELHHKSEHSVTVDGHQKPGSFVQDIKYLASSDQIEALISQSVECWQYIRYDCFRSRLLNSPSSEDNFQPFSWWVSRNNQKMDFWGGAPAGSRKCACGIRGTCKNQTNNMWCNCDAGFYEWRSDGGDIKGKEYLPVKQLRFGDTGTLYDDKKGKYLLGSLKCNLNDIHENVVTFKKADATINLSNIDFGETTDIYFEFKTAVLNGLLIDAVCYGNNLRVELRDGNTIFVRYYSNGKSIMVSKKNDLLLTNVEWHSVYIEINVKGVYISLDGGNAGTESLEPLLSMTLVSSFTIGGSATDQNPIGFVGCMRAFTLNGKLVDLMAAARRKSYGLSLGCVGKCDSNPCLNNGLCYEYYESYSCDCRWTSFKGPICADDIGITLKGNSMVKYKFTNVDRSTISENIRIGFTTTHSQGFLISLFSNLSNEYLTISLTNGGDIRVIFDFGFERQELIYRGKNFALGQFHDLRLTRKNSGSSIFLQIDNKEPEEYPFRIRSSADVQFDKIQYLYIGKNESMDRGFIGCISRVEFDDIYPLKLLFQQNPPENIKSFPPETVTEDFCGVEPITYPPEKNELRPSPDLDCEKVLRAYHKINVALVGVTLTVMFVLSVGVSFLLGRYISNRRAQYHTQEQLGADFASDADTAVIYSKTGSQVRKKHEWFL